MSVAVIVGHYFGDSGGDGRMLKVVVDKVQSLIKRDTCKESITPPDWYSATAGAAAAFVLDHLQEL